MSSAWFHSVVLLMIWPFVRGDRPAQDLGTGPPPHGSEDEEYYLEDTGEKEYYYYDQDEYYEYFQDRKPIAPLRNRRMDKSIKKIRRLVQAAAVQACNETELIHFKSLCEKKMDLVKTLQNTTLRGKVGKASRVRKICRLVTQYADCISAMVPSGDCPDVAFRLKTDAQRSIYRQGFQMCRSPGLASPHFLLVTAALLLVCVREAWPE